MQVAIIGAGMAGLAAARALKAQHAAWEITVYEKSRGVGGRVASRRRDAYIFDHGAQVIKGPTPDVLDLLTKQLDITHLRQIDLPTWTFDSAGTISEGDSAQNAERTYYYTDGNNRLGKLLAEGIDLRRELRVASLRRDTQWHLLDSEGHELGRAELVLLTPPGPQSYEIIAASSFAPTAQQALLGELGGSTYRRCLSLALAYDRLIPRPFYALLNSDRQHPLSWLALEHVKGPERCPAGHSLLIAQLAPTYSAANYESSIEQLVPQVTAMIGAVLGEDLDTPLWADLQRWRYALPASAADFDRLQQLGAAHGLYFAGDFVDQRGRIHLAIERGWQVAALLTAANQSLERGDTRS